MSLYQGFGWTLQYLKMTCLIYIHGRFSLQVPAFYTVSFRDLNGRVCTVLILYFVTMNLLDICSLGIFPELN